MSAAAADLVLDCREETGARRALDPADRLLRRIEVDGRPPGRTGSAGPSEPRVSG